MTNDWEDVYAAGEDLDAAAQKILATKYGGDRSKYPLALADASQADRAKVEAYMPDTAGLPDEMAAPVDQPLARAKKGKFIAAVNETLADKFGNDPNHYTDAVMEVKRARPELFAAGQVGQPDTTGAPPYMRLLSPELEAKSKLAAPATAYPGQATL